MADQDQGLTATVTTAAAPPATPPSEGLPPAATLDAEPDAALGHSIEHRSVAAEAEEVDEEARDSTRDHNGARRAPNIPGVISTGWRKVGEALDQLMQACTPEALQQYWQAEADKAQEAMDMAATSHQRHRAEQRLQAARRALASGGPPEVLVVMVDCNARVSMVQCTCVLVLRAA
jgi:hypothetical protein